ncbi:hypothetical protein K2X14_14445 [Acetobacter sp. TBRC 12305]|uniref:Uncharacterized protein n=1 Tax=Acetobacter garciniae TaxID=2817435 RepID=A0A939HQN9_9PROT|nr:hypothetical protein [Acetobacter garciniae]MBO1326227.1 hypothetical protein [Acetobacter garciniae]MBX0346035.1 hypothetical protein [Acetobacter garciniae]
MAALTGAVSATGPGEARERLLLALHDAGIAVDSPLGILFALLGEQVALSREMVGQAITRIEHAEKMACSDLTRLRDELATGYERIQGMNLYVEGRIKVEQQQLAQRQQETIDRLVASVVSGLKDAVFDKLRQRIPLTEGLFYREMRWRAYALVFVAAATLLVSGAGLALFVTWPETQRGRYCLTHGHRDVHKGQDWCELTPLTDPGTP